MGDLSFQKWQVYKDALDHIEESAALFKTIPKGNGEVIDQLKRAGISIATNISEGAGKFDRLDKRRYYRSAGGSAFECVGILDIMLRLGVISDLDHQRMTERLKSISRGLVGLQKGAMNR